MIIDALEYPELVFALAGPIGIDIDGLADEVATALSAVGYSSEIVRLTELTSRANIGVALPPLNSSSFFDTMMWKMECANTIRREKSDPAYLARLAMLEIRERRQRETGDPHVVRARHAYIIRQLKLPAEVNLFRRVYGKQFFLVSGYADLDQRLSLLESNIKRLSSTRTMKSQNTSRALQLAERDQGEEFDYGQQLRDTFHLADVFVEGIKRPLLRAQLSRFVDALFGRNDVSPTKDEYGMYAAKSASLRSADLSRQVGAALFSSDGELITQGCNEAPKAGGGTYWAGEEPDNRDVKKGFDPNEAVKRELLRDLVERLRERSLLPESLMRLGDDETVVATLLAPDGPLRGAVLMDLTEFGRVVHAEMSALCDAARLGRPVKGSKLYCTTFPCHNCTKHILAAGIDRVIFMEPYPKSRAEQLHEDEISVGGEAGPGRVSFVPFMGIAPTRYRDLFEKGRRKDKQGQAQEWQGGTPRPRVDIVYPGHPEAELWAVHSLVGTASDRIAPER